jgi:Arc/MetJ-type ribon-helix-helix transcriptional regulator
MFKDSITLRIGADLAEKIKELVRVDGGEKFYNVSHVIRCAIIKLHRDEILKVLEAKNHVKKSFKFAS